MARPEKKVSETVLREMAKRLPIWEIAAKLGVSAGTVRNRMKSLGIKSRGKIAPPRTAGPRAEKVQIDSRELRRLVREGYSKVAIAKYFGCARETIVKRLKRAN